jgi:hypothetical protein
MNTRSDGTRLVLERYTPPSESVQAGPTSLSSLRWTVSYGVELQPKLQPPNCQLGKSVALPTGHLHIR